MFLEPQEIVGRSLICLTRTLSTNRSVQYSKFKLIQALHFPESIPDQGVAETSYTPVLDVNLAEEYAAVVLA